MNYDSPQDIRSFLTSLDLGPRKRWGQNFLINSGARRKILKALDMKEGQKVWEIGPGLGAMTEMILDQNVDLTVFEIDPAYVKILNQFFASRGIHIHEGDVLKTWQAEKKTNGIPDRIIGNLPSNAASAIIAALIEKEGLPGKMVFTVQNEMGQRMTAVPGTKNYSSFSILCQYACKVTDHGVLNPGSFYPVPRVSSRIIAMEPHSLHGSAVNWELFLILIRELFVSRRKTLRNNISAAARHRLQPYGRELLEEAFSLENVDLTLRPERLEVADFVRLANRIDQLEKSR